MKTQGEGFSYFLDGVKLKDFDDFEKRIRNIEIIISVRELEIHAKTIKNAV